ncbi:hypothetical protein OF83DRAFT_1105863 [Amylostereum chailletii]|nr:hypothetical protein OF83DRAFT_1105863 [Amylostereum chailletii]
MSISTENPNTGVTPPPSYTKMKRKHEHLDTDSLQDLPTPADKKRKKHKGDVDADAADIPSSKKEKKIGKKSGPYIGENRDEQGEETRAEGSGEKKRKKKKRDSDAELVVTHLDDPIEKVIAQETHAPNAETRKEKKERRKQRRELDDVDGAFMGTTGPGKTKRTKKGRGVEEDVKSAEADVSIVEEDRKAKKKKNNRDAEVDADSQAASTPKKKSEGDTREPETKEARKERKKRTKGLTDPEGDDSLFEQASKALLYAYSQFSDPSSWKFQKARQNWLLRNLWSETNIPETYIPLVTRYFSNTQGGIRENLIKMCRSHLSPPIAAEAAAEGTQDETSPAALAPSVPSDALCARAQFVLDALAVDAQST